MSLLDFAGSLLSGGATGLIGIVIQRFADIKNKQLDMQLEKQRGELELAKRDKDALIMREEWAGRLKVADREGEAKEDVAASEAFAKSFETEPQRFSDASKLSNKQQWIMVLLDGARGIVRPALTVYLCALTTYVWFQVKQQLSIEDLAAADVLAIWRLVVETILYLTTTCVLWWFGTRNRAKQPGSK